MTTLKAQMLATAERALATAGQTLAALIGSTALLGDLDWPLVGSGVAMATLLSLAKSLAGVKLAPGSGPALFGPEDVSQGPGAGS